MRDYEADAQKAAEDHWFRCVEALEYQDIGEGEEVEFPEGAEMFCGCETCSVREILTAAWPHLRLAARAEFADELEVELNQIWGEERASWVAPA